MSGGHVAPLRSDKDFIPALRDLMAEQGLSFRKLVAETERYRDGGYALGYMTTLVSGRSKPAPETMRILALAAGADEMYFREYREHVAAERARELATRVGLDEVLAALEAIEPKRRRGKR